LPFAGLLVVIITQELHVFSNGSQKETSCEVIEQRQRICAAINKNYEDATSQASQQARQVS